MTRIDPAALAEKLAGNSLARRIIVLEETPSTNLAAKALAAEDAPSGTLVLANRQTAGRGRRGRAWQSEAGAAVCMSLLLRPEFPAEWAPRITIAAALGGRVIGILNTDDGISRVCEMPEAMEFASFLRHVKDSLGANGLRYAGPGKPVRRFGICGGSGAGDLPLALAQGCDTFVTADVKHHQFIQANEEGINLIDAGHFSTENVVVPVLKRWLNEDFPDLDVRISERHCQPEKFYV